MPEFFTESVLWGVLIWQLIAASIILFLSFAARRLIQAIFTGVLKRYAAKTKVAWDDDLVEFIPSPLAALAQVGLWRVAVGFLALPNEPIAIETYVLQGLQVAIGLALMWLILRMIDVFAASAGRLSANTESSLDDQLVPLIRKTLKTITVITVSVMVVQNLGYSVTSVLASLGVGGLALALAAQDTVANVFGSVVVFTDRPFQVGDWVEFDGIQGTVEEVGFRTTRVRRFDKSLVTVPNQTFSTTAIVNHSMRNIRRIKMTVGVTYEANADKMEGLLASIRELLKQDEALDQGFNFAHFVNFGASSLDIQIYCFTKSTVWTEFLTAQEELMLRIMRTVEEHGMEMAFPTQTVYLRDEQWPMQQGQ